MKVHLSVLWVEKYIIKKGCKEQKKKGYIDALKARDGFKICCQSFRYMLSNMWKMQEKQTENYKYFGHK